MIDIIDEGTTKTILTVPNPFEVSLSNKNIGCFTYGFVRGPSDAIWNKASVVASEATSEAQLEVKVWMDGLTV